jgi:DNA replication protein DnaC
MLTQSTYERLHELKIPGFVAALKEQLESQTYSDLSFAERLTLLIDSEHTRRLNLRTKRLTVSARLPQSVTLEDVDFSVPRGIQKLQFVELCQGNWLSSGTNLIFTGATGTGKTFLASAVAHSLISQGFSLKFQRTNIWLADLALWFERKRLTQTIIGFRRIPVLIFDEWLLDKLSHQDSRLLLELFESRYNRYSCIFISQIPVNEWHSRFQDPTIADAILDRLVHNAIRVNLSGDSMRRHLASSKIIGNLSNNTIKEGKDTSLRSDKLDL